MIYFFGKPSTIVYAVQIAEKLNEIDQKKLVWLFGNNSLINEEKVSGDFIGPRISMVTPWSTNAVEITQNMDITGIIRIECFNSKKKNIPFDPMLF
jgi:phosphoribosylformylglycinamidine synthase